MAWALTQRPWGWSKRGGEKIPAKYWGQKVKIISAFRESTTILSSEFFSELNGEKIRKVRNDFAGRDIQILFTVRPLAKLLPSTYQQYLKYGTVAEYDEWLHSVLDKPGESRINPTFWKRHSHGKVIARWADVFGAENVTALIVNEAQPTFLFEFVNEYLGLPEGTLGSTETGSNRSLTMEEIALLLEINRQFPKSRNWDEYQIFVRNGYIRELTDHIAPAPGSARLLTPEWAVERANEIGAQIRDEINSLGVTVVGDMASLGNSIVPVGQSVYPETINIKTVVSAMLSSDRRTVNSFPLEWVQRSLRHRIKRTLKHKLKHVLKN